MVAFIVRRSLLALLTIWALSVISFVVIQLVMLVGALTVIGTLMSDILLGILDPRIRVG